MTLETSLSLQERHGVVFGEKSNKLVYENDQICLPKTVTLAPPSTTNIIFYKENAWCFVTNFNQN